MLDRIIIIVVVLVILGAFYARRAANNHFECPQCGAHFQVSFLAFMFAPHMMGERSVTCPKCGNAAMLTPLPGKE